MSEFDPVKDTQTSAVLARFDDKGIMQDKRNVDKLILTLLEQRDWHQEQTALFELYISTLEKRLNSVKD